MKIYYLSILLVHFNLFGMVKYRKNETSEVYYCESEKIAVYHDFELDAYGVVPPQKDRSKNPRNAFIVLKDRFEEQKREKARRWINWPSLE